MVDLCRGRIWGDATFTLPRLYGSWYLGKSDWGVDMTSPMLDTPGSTPVWAQCIFRFLLYKIYVYVKCFQNIYVVQKNTGGLWPRLGLMRFRICFWPPIDFIKLTFDTTDDFLKMFSYMTDFSLSHYELLIICLMLI